MKNGKPSTFAEGWQWRKFGDCAQFINGRAYSHEELLDAGTPILRIQNLNGGDRWYYSNLKLPAAVKSAAHGVAMLHMTKGGIEAWPIRLPPLAEQRRIAEVLDRAEALLAKRRTALAQLDSLTQSIFLDLFGDIGKEPKQWLTVPLEEIILEAKLGLVRGSQEFGPDFPIPYVRMNAIKRSGEFELRGIQRTHATDSELKAYRLQPGDFLFNTRNSEELVGKTALYRGEGFHIFNNNLMRVRFTAKADPVFVAAAFRTNFIQHELNLRKSGTTNVFAIYYKDLRTLPIPLPPPRVAARIRPPRYRGKIEGDTTRIVGRAGRAFRLPPAPRLPRRVVDNKKFIHSRIMFTRVQTRSFRCLKTIDQALGPFRALVGPNASGKSTFLDVIGFLGDLVRSRGEVVETVRQRSNSFEKLLWMGLGNSFQLGVEAVIPTEVRKIMAEEKRRFTHVRYEVEVGLDPDSNEIGLDYETLWLKAPVKQQISVQRELFPAPQPR